MEYIFLATLAIIFYFTMIYTIFIEEDPTSKALQELLEVSDKDSEDSSEGEVRGRNCRST